MSTALLFILAFLGIWTAREAKEPHADSTPPATDTAMGGNKADQPAVVVLGGRSPVLWWQFVFSTCVGI